MKMNQLALATLAVFAASQAVANPQYLTGTQTVSVKVMTAAKNLCVAGGGTFKLFKNNTTTTNLGNYFTGECEGVFYGTSLSSVRMNVTGGSLSAVPATTTNYWFLAPVEAACTAITGTGPLSIFSDADSTLYKCPGSQVNDWHQADSGFLDVEGPVFNSALNTAYNPNDFIAIGWNQVFGVAVNSTLYNALQVAQGLSTACMTDTRVKYTAACQPSISKAQIGSLINGDVFNAAKTAGGKFLVGGTDSTKITYCQYAQSSGIQQAAQLYFLNHANTGDLGGKESVVPGGISLPKYSSTIALHEGVESFTGCLNAPNDYRFGILSLVNNPLRGTDTYRFVKLNGVAAAQGAGASDSNTATAVTGEYDFVFETKAYCVGRCPAFVEAMMYYDEVAVPPDRSGSLGDGLFSSFRSGFSRGGYSAAPYIAR